jgi:hypothetical protein
MAHPVMYDEDDPVLARLREIALSFLGAAEKVTHGWPAFYTVKVFGYYGGSIKIDGTYVRHDQSLLVIPDPGGVRGTRAGRACVQTCVPRSVRVARPRSQDRHGLDGGGRTPRRVVPAHGAAPADL